MSSSTPTDEELLDALPHIREVMDLVGTVMILRSRRIREGFKEIVGEEHFPHLENALLDATLINIRILDEFFDQPRGDRIVSRHYGFHPARSLLSKQTGIAINNHFGHLTWRRIRERSYQWKGALFVSAIRASLAFLNHIADDFLRGPDPRRQIELKNVELLVGHMKSFLEKEARSQKRSTK